MLERIIEILNSNDRGHNYTYHYKNGKGVPLNSIQHELTLVQSRIDPDIGSHKDPIVLIKETIVMTKEAINIANSSYTSTYAVAISHLTKKLLHTLLQSGILYIRNSLTK